MENPLGPEHWLGDGNGVLYARACVFGHLAVIICMCVCAGMCFWEFHPVLWFVCLCVLLHGLCVLTRV